MPRNGGGVFSLPTTYEAVSGQTIEAQQHNDPLEDLEQDMNTARPIVAGGTGETTAIGAADAFSTKGANIASATTTDIGAATGRFVHITGTTTITGLGTKTAGVVRVLIFDGALTLTHNATSLILPGGANIATAAGDRAFMISEGGGNWTCLAYVRATGLSVVGAGKGTAIASASTISIGSENFYHVTGTTTITDIDFAVPNDGRVAILEFDDALTLTHNATTLVLPGAVNITTAAGDIAVLVQDNSDNVHVVAFQRAAGNVSRVVRQIFTSNGTYTPTPGMLYADIEGVGAGAGGGGTGVSSAGQQASAGGGGGGEYALKRVTAADVGASKAVAIGAAGGGGAAGNNNGTAGGDTSVGFLLIARGGSPGIGNNANSGSAGGAGGTGGTGDILIPGQDGSNGAGGSGLTVDTFGGAGGMSGRAFGMGARARRSESQPGNNGTGYGSGGGGGMDRNGTSARAGGNGTAGIVIITEYVQ